MKQSEWKILEKSEYDFLDSLDLKQIICENQDKDCYEIREIIEDKYEDEYIEKNTVGDECLFNVISIEEFITYIYKRYGIKFHEETHYYFDI